MTPTTTHRTGSILFLAGKEPAYWSAGMTAGPGTEKVYLGAGWYTIPEGLSGIVPDTSWDGRGENVRLEAGDIVRLDRRGSPESLATIEVARRDDLEATRASIQAGR